MATIKMDDLKTMNEESLLEAAAVKGGAWYAKFDGVDGSATDTTRSTPKLQEAVANGTF